MGLGQADTSQCGQNLRIFSANPKNVILSEENRNFEYKFNDPKDVANKTGFSRPTVIKIS